MRLMMRRSHSWSSTLALKHSAVYRHRRENIPREAAAQEITVLMRSKAQNVPDDGNAVSP